MSLIGRFRQICTEVEAEFERNRRRYGARIQCRPGCADCCHQLFQITEIEAAVISEGVRRLDPEIRQRLQERARAYLEERRKLVGERGQPEAWGNLPPPGTRLACPALEDGLCRIYEWRPLICRKFGMPLYNPDKPGRVFACELNFRNGEEIADSQLVTIQTGIHERWKRLQADYNASGGYRDPHPLTVARALLEDFSDLLADPPHCQRTGMLECKDIWHPEASTK
ncbi:MAG: YkgJ family cysteine cluster protein [Bryobacterales bacterium]|nr:YkgJ family cysteine cluster protein [Bryobacteraceae bacterium]MDW8353215.1 YkgJ family cysteine cluster protein [Bryobacterales bacterium]